MDRMLEQSGGTGLLREVINEVVNAIGLEMSATSSDPSSNIDVRAGRPVGHSGPDRLWSFEFDGFVPVQPETPAVLHVRGRDPVPATLVAIGDLDLVVSVREELGEELPFAQLSLDPWFIYDRLRVRLLAANDLGTPSPMTEAVLDMVDIDTADAPIVDGLPAADSVGDEQSRAAFEAARSGLRFVWGPPGTGKTRTLAATVRALATRGERVLVVAHSNAAVDVSMVRIADELQGLSLVDEDRVLRVGTPQSAEARARAEILPDEIIRRRFPDLVGLRDRLEGERRRMSRDLNTATNAARQQELTRRLEAVREELVDVDRRIREVRVDVIDGAQVIGATLSRLVIDDLIWNWGPTHVVVDEASMAGVPFVLAISMCNPVGLAFFGDFRQLPPISVSETNEAQRWFAHDVFEVSGVVSRVERGEHDRRLSTLRTQYRMGQQIADVVGEFAYFGFLRTDESAEVRAQHLAELGPGEGSQIVVLDTSGISSACLRDASLRSFSRFNPLTAAFCTSIVHDMQLSEQGDVGVISPYRAQARLITAILGNSDRVLAATAHKFQGSERDSIILDLTDADPQEGASRLTGTDDDLTLRLLNVSISRARGKLVVVADLGFLADRHAPVSKANQLLELLNANGAVRIAAERVIPLTGSGGVQWFDGWSAAMGSVGDGLDLIRRVDLSLPDRSFDGEWLDSLTERRSLDGCIRVPAQVAGRIKAGHVDVRLKTLGPAPILVLDDSIVYVGGRFEHSPAARLEGAGVVSALRRLLTPER